MSKAEAPHRTEEVRAVLEELVKQGIMRTRTVNGVTQYQLTPENELTPEARLLRLELDLQCSSTSITASDFLN